jgi:orotate phosphoribosyltransferase
MTPDAAAGAESIFGLIKEHAYGYREEPFTLASGRRSHHYFNCKKITLHPRRLRSLCMAIHHRFFQGGLLAVPPAVGGLTLGADPISYGLTLYLMERGHDCYPLIVRKEAKGHGTGQQIEGALDTLSGADVIALDDVITTGGSTLKAIQALREAGLKVSHALCIIDRQEGGSEALASHDVTLHSMFRKSDFIVEGMLQDD